MKTNVQVKGRFRGEYRVNTLETKPTRFELLYPEAK